MAEHCSSVPVSYRPSAPLEWNNQTLRPKPTRPGHGVLQRGKHHAEGLPQGLNLLTTKMYSRVFSNSW